MKDITPKRDQDAWRGTPRTVQPWAEIDEYWADWVTKRPNLQPLHQLVHTLASSPVSDKLFGRIMSLGDGTGIFVSDTADFRSTDGTLEIRFIPSGNHFEFWHRTFSGHNDHKLCQASEAIETLRLFLRYKYGILLEGP